MGVEVELYLQYWHTYYNADKDNRKLYDGDEKPKPPPYFLLYRRLKLWAGKHGQMPFLMPGSYLEQPYLATVFLEACAEAERKFELDILNNAKMDKKQ